MSDSVRPHRQQPTRLPCPGDSPGKNTEVGCHFLLQCMKVKSESEVIQSCLTLSDPMDWRPPGFSVHGIFQARVLEWGAIAFSVKLPYDLVIAFLVFFPRENKWKLVFTQKPVQEFHRSFIYYSWKLEIPHLFISRWMIKHIEVHL